MLLCVNFIFTGFTKCAFEEIIEDIYFNEKSIFLKILFHSHMKATCKCPEMVITHISQN